MKREQGFTIVEVIIAVLVLTIGLLALVTSSALVTRMIARGQRSAVSSTFAAQRLERLRISGCRSPVGGSEVLYRGAVPVDSLTWRFIAAPLAQAGASGQHYRVVVRSKYMTQIKKWRTDSMETELSCIS